MGSELRKQGAGDEEEGKFECERVRLVGHPGGSSCHRHRAGKLQARRPCVKLRVLSICIWAKELLKQQIRKSKGKETHRGSDTDKKNQA